MISFSFIHGAAGDAGSSEESKVAIEIESLDAHASVDFVESRHEQASKTAGWHLTERTSADHMIQNGSFQQAFSMIRPMIGPRRSDIQRRPFLQEKRSVDRGILPVS